MDELNGGLGHSDILRSGHESKKLIFKNNFSYIDRLLRGLSHTAFLLIVGCYEWPIRQYMSKAVRMVFLDSPRITF
jgi:hypothetical protein